MCFSSNYNKLTYFMIINQPNTKCNSQTESKGTKKNRIFMSLAAGFIIKFILFFFKIQQIIKMELYTEEILKIYKKDKF